MKIQTPIFTAVLALHYLLLLSPTTLLARATKCNTGFMRAFGLKGRKDSRFGAVEMCSGVKESCCTHEDQMVMYGAWVSGKTHEKISHRYKTLSIVYDGLLAQLKTVNEFAKQVEDLMRLKKFSNCKFLANRITSYRLPTVEASLKRSLEDMGTFFTDAYKGIYCTMCNAENHKFILEKKSTLVLNEDTCRVMTEKTLGPMLYFHVHLNKYINLVTKFMTSCDFRGDYELDVVMPREFIFTANDDIKKSLGECKLYRNTKQWLVYCKDVCEKFTIGKFDAFFEPNRIKVAKYTLYLKRLIKEYIRKEKSMPLFNTNIDGGSAGGNNMGPENNSGQQGNNGPKNVRMLAVGDSNGSNGSNNNNNNGPNNNGPNNNGRNNNGNNQNGPNFDPNDPNNEDRKDKLFELITTMEKEKEVTTFKFDTSSPVSASAFKTTYKRTGIDLVAAGQASVFEEAIFNQVKTIVNLQRLASTSAGELTQAQRDMLAASSDSRLSALVCGFVVAVLMRLW